MRCDHCGLSILAYYVVTCGNMYHILCLNKVLNKKRPKEVYGILKRRTGCEIETQKATTVSSAISE
jgi:hypothetical protein